MIQMSNEYSWEQRILLKIQNKWTRISLQTDQHNPIQEFAIRDSNSKLNPVRRNGVVLNVCTYESSLNACERDNWT
jgi:hypothetical protein